MADAHGDTDLRRLEREAEAARARLNNTIAEIKDPRTVENAKLEMKERAEEVKDQILGYITGAKEDALESGRQQGNEFTRRLQRTAIGNPLSVALIGAGIGWHLYKRPPITTVLIGAGLYTMFKGWDATPNDAAFRDPYNRVSPRGYVPGGVAGYGYEDEKSVAGVTDRVKTAAANLSYGAQNVVADVQDAISGATDRVREAVGIGADKAQAGAVHAADDMARLGARTADRAGAQVQDATSRVKDVAETAADTARSLAGDATATMRDASDKASDLADTAISSARGLADSAADTVRSVADEAQRRAQPVIDRVGPYVDQHRNQLGMLLVLGGVGALAGSWLRGSETGRKWMNDANEAASGAWQDVRDRMRDGASEIRNGASDMSRRASVEDWRDEAVSAASSAASRVSEQADSLRRNGMQRADDLRHRSADTMRSAQELGSEHPVLLSALGLAIGAVLGGMIRQTAFENQTFGDMAQDLKDTAADALQTNMETLSDKAGAVASAVSGMVSGDGSKAAPTSRGRVDA